MLVMMATCSERGRFRPRANGLGQPVARGSGSAAADAHREKGHKRFSPPKSQAHGAK